jgi:hypothetical protein
MRSPRPAGKRVTGAGNARLRAPQGLDAGHGSVVGSSRTRATIGPVRAHVT